MLTEQEQLWFHGFLQHSVLNVYHSIYVIIVVDFILGYILQWGKGTTQLYCAAYLLESARVASYSKWLQHAHAQNIICCHSSVTQTDADRSQQQSTMTFT